MSEPTPESTAPEPERIERRHNAQYWVDLIVKLTVPASAVALGIFAHFYDERSSARNILNQREQSESSLRASMFGNLIGPIVGEQKSDKTIDPDRYRLLVEMLALNFHENVEFKPLMEDADRRLALAAPTLMSKQDALEGRKSLRGIAHRVVERQLAMLGEESSNPLCGGSDLAKFSLISAKDEKVANEVKGLLGITAPIQVMTADSAVMPTYRVVSPDCVDQLSISFYEPDLEKGSVMVQVKVTKAGEKGAADKGGRDLAVTVNFELTSFDFPFTDNTLLSDGNRFAVYLEEYSSVPGTNAAVYGIGLRWFPKNYFPPRERPTDHRRIRDALNLSSQDAR
jgi:hypothetical protein